MIRRSILTLMLLAFIGGVTAQTLQFEWNGQVFADGEEIICTNDEYGYGEIIQHMQVRNLTDNSLDVILEQEIIQNLEGTMISFCFGQCYAPGTNVSGPVAILPHQVNDEQNDMTLHVLYDGVHGTVVMKYYAYAQNDPENKISIYVRFGYGADGVSESVASMGHAYPNPATSSVRFNVEGVANANIAIYNLLGQEVLNQKVEAGQATISVADLEKGIYFCNLVVNGKTVSTEKLVVK